MAFQPAPDIARFTMVFTGPDSQSMVNVYHMETDPGIPWDSFTLGSTAELFYNWWAASMRAYVSNQTRLDYVEAVDLSVQGGAYERTIGPAIAGSSTSPALAAHTTLSVKWSTGYSGRSHRGRTYHIGLTESQVTGNYIAPSAGATFTTAYNNLLPAVNAAGVRHLVVLSRFTNGGPRIWGVGYRIINASLVDLRVDTQRRRLPRVTL